MPLSNEVARKWKEAIFA